MHLTLSGGEIYSRPDFEEIATEAKNMGFALNIFTNATMLTKEKVSFIKNLGVLEVGISILSIHDEVHDAITKKPGSLQKTLEGLKLLTDQDVRVKVRCLIMKNNLKDYEKVRTLAMGYGATCQYDTTLMPGGGNDQSILGERLEKDDLIKIFSDPNVHHISENPLAYDGTHQTVVKDNFEDFQLMCGAGITYLSINPYGEVFSCVQQLDPAGSLLNQSLEDIWETSPTFTRARGVTFDSLESCSSCSNNHICGRCPALAEKEDGDFLGPSSIACTTSDALRTVYETKYGTEATK